MQRNNYANFMGQGRKDRVRIIESKLAALPVDHQMVARAEIFAREALLRMVMGEAAFSAWKHEQGEMLPEDWLLKLEAKKAEIL